MIFTRKRLEYLDMDGDESIVAGGPAHFKAPTLKTKNVHSSSSGFGELNRSQQRITRTGVVFGASTAAVVLGNFLGGFAGKL